MAAAAAAAAGSATTRGAAEDMNATLDFLNSVDKSRAAVALRKCLASSVWVEAMVVKRPFKSMEEVLATAQNLAQTLRDNEWAELLKVNATRTDELSNLESAYLDKFGFCFVSKNEKGRDDREAEICTALQQGHLPTELAKCKQLFTERCVQSLKTMRGELDHCVDNSRIDLSWDPQPAKKVLWGGVDYHQSVTDKITATESSVTGTSVANSNGIASDAMAEIEAKKLPIFFGGAWR